MSTISEKRPLTAGTKTEGRSLKLRQVVLPALGDAGAAGDLQELFDSEAAARSAAEGRAGASGCVAPVLEHGAALQAYCERACLG